MIRLDKILKFFKHCHDQGSELYTLKSIQICADLCVKNSLIYDIMFSKNFNYMQFIK